MSTNSPEVMRSALKAARGTLGDYIHAAGDIDETDAALLDQIDKALASPRATPQVQGEALSEAARRVAWMIEREFVDEIRWFAENSVGRHWWTKDANEAKQFASRAEAEAFPAYQMIASDPTISLTEHVFLPSASLSGQPASAGAGWVRDDDETYDIGKRDGYEDAIQDLDLATGGDGEFRGSTFPGETVDVPTMKLRIIDRFGPAVSWIAGNGDGTKWRKWTAEGPAWVDDRNDATRYARREDAEAVHGEDEDVWVVEPFDALSNPEAPAAAVGEDAHVLAVIEREFGSWTCDGRDGETYISQFIEDERNAYRAALATPPASTSAVETPAEAEARIVQDYRWGNLTTLGVANHLRRAGFRTEVAIEKSNALNSQAPAMAVPGEMVEAGKFLVDRLANFERGDFDEEEWFNEYYGHVTPAVTRFRAVLASLPDGGDQSATSHAGKR